MPAGNWLAVSMGLNARMCSLTRERGSLLRCFGKTSNKTSNETSKSESPIYFSSQVTWTSMSTLSVPASIGTGFAAPFASIIGAAMVRGT